MNLFRESPKFVLALPGGVEQDEGGESGIRKCCGTRERKTEFWIPTEIPRRRLRASAPWRRLPLPAQKVRCSSGGVEEVRSNAADAELEEVGRVEVDDG